MACPSGLEPESATPCGCLSSPTLWSPGEMEWSARRPAAYPANPAHVLCRAARKKKCPRTWHLTCKNTQLVDIYDITLMPLSKCTLVLVSAPMTRVIGLMPSVLGMKRRRDMTVALGRDEISAGVSSSI